MSRISLNTKRYFVKHFVTLNFKVCSSIWKWSTNCAIFVDLNYGFCKIIYKSININYIPSNTLNSIKNDMLP